MKNQKGFTLVEMAIVLVIIGLLLGGVLKGQELIKNSKVKALANDASGIASAMNGYQDRFRALPGDDINAKAHVGTAAENGNGNGVVEGGLQAGGSSTGEGLEFFKQLAASKLFTAQSATGGTEQAPTTSYVSSLGAPMGVLTNALGSGTNSLNACFLSVPGDIARFYETTYDDGVPNTGRVRLGESNSLTTASATALTPTTDTNTYSLCAVIN